MCACIHAYTHNINRSHLHAYMHACIHVCMHTLIHVDRLTDRLDVLLLDCNTSIHYHTYTDAHTQAVFAYIHADRAACRPAVIHAYRQTCATGSLTDGHIANVACIHAIMLAYKQTTLPTYRLASSQAVRHTTRQTYRQTRGQSDRPTDILTCRDITVMQTD